MPTITKWFKKIASMFAEKPPVEKNDFELEHFLLYHGLVGSSPENQRQFKDVRADVKMAYDNRSAQQMSAVLKLSPLWWEEKLKTIFTELGDRETFITILSPPIRDDAMSFDNVPLLHSDWQVRSNAALLLAHLDATEEFEKMARALHDTARGARVAFPHQAYALARLGNPAAEEVLAGYLRDEDPWIRVDAAGALAELTQEKRSSSLLEALLMRHPLSDYSAVAVTRSIPPVKLLTSPDRLARQAGCELIVGMLEAARQTFSDDIVVAQGVHECFPALAEMLKTDQSAQTKRAALLLAEWLESHNSYTLLAPPSHEAVEKTLADIRSSASIKQVSERVSELLSQNAQQEPEHISELRNAILLSGLLDVRDAVPALRAALRTDHPMLDEIVETLGELQAKEASSRLIEIAETLVDIEQRGEPTKQAHPVHETDLEKSKTYWLILKSMAEMPDVPTLNFLLKAIKDHAPDKRAQAFKSLIAVAASLNNEPAVKHDLMPAVSAELNEALSDPSAEVKKTVLRGIAELNLPGDLKKIVALTRAREVSVGREAFATLSELAKKGHKKEVIESVAQSLKTETDVHKRQRLRDFIDANQG